MKGKYKAERDKAQELKIDAMFRDNLTNVVPVNLEEEMRKSFIDYAMSVISDRALPDVRDGLKPVHRRILYSMFTQGYSSDKSYRKSASTVGDVISRFHPHGDAAVYDAMVRLAQDFSMRYMLVDSHGNFGSRDGDPPAAYRYTEARMAKLAETMMQDINKSTVDFRPNFDDHHVEPVVLPANFPNLLVNGSVGIAVGMATNIPPHNIRETVQAAIYLMEHPEADVEELMQFIKGPDFPTAGIILGTSGIKETYKTGHGRIVVRANAEIVDTVPARIIVHDLPYMVNKARLLEKISELVKLKRITGISAIRDESDRNEDVRIVIELKKDANALVTLNQLYANSQMQDSFNAHLLALVPNKDGALVPELLNLKSALQYYIDHQRQVIYRRTQFNLEKAELRQHILEGLKIAVANIDEIIRIIRASKSENDAKLNLQTRFNFSDRQAQHIVDMRLGRLSGLEVENLYAEYDEISARIQTYREILAEPKVLDGVLKTEVTAVMAQYADERRTEIDPYGVDGIDDESLIKEETVLINLTQRGYIKRLAADTYNMQHRGGKGITGMTIKDEDCIHKMITASTHDDIFFFSNLGKVYRLRAYAIHEASRTAKGTPIVNMLQLEANEKIIELLAVPEAEEKRSLIIVTKQGLIKKTKLSEFKNINKNGKIAFALREGDELVSAALATADATIMLVSHDGMAMRFLSQDVRPVGRKSFGVRGIRLKKDDYLIGVVVEQADEDLFLLTEDGYGKRSHYADFRLAKRGGMGVKAYNCTEKTGKVLAICSLQNDYDIILINDAGMIIRISSREINLQGRNTQGLRLMRSEHKLAALAKVLPEDTDSNEQRTDEVSALEPEADETDDI